MSDDMDMYDQMQRLVDDQWNRSRHNIEHGFCYTCKNGSSECLNHPLYPEHRECSYYERRY